MNQSYPPHTSTTSTVHVLMLAFVYLFGMFMGFVHERDFDVFITLSIGTLAGIAITSYILVACTE